MKIQALDYSTKKPLANFKIKLQIESGDSLSVTTDQYGYFQLDDNYQGQQISTYSNKTQPITAEEGAVLYVEVKETAQAGSDTAVYK
jgi:hypothetical protein